ncbi:MATE family efflux transporter [Paenibacillus alkaliterrae]|uniref:MATE family efflux transporter n=1 Tax=Paenibacillus alkaliterrae TaxID=320909 RepID=UPI0038B35CA1
MLAANAVLIQFHYLIAYFFDGFANASSILTGKSIGAKDGELYKKSISLSWQWSIYTSCLLALVYYLNKDWIMQAFIVFSLGRSLFLLLYLPRLNRKLKFKKRKQSTSIHSSSLPLDGT